MYLVLLSRSGIAGWDHGACPPLGYCQHSPGLRGFQTLAGDFSKQKVDLMKSVSLASWVGTEDCTNPMFFP